MNIKHVSKQTIIRTVILLIALINTGLQMFGYNTIPITGDEVGEVISFIFLIVSSVISWWKNNSFTSIAQKADELIIKMKSNS